MQPDSTPVLVRPEGEFVFPDQWAKVIGTNELGCWWNSADGSTHLLKPMTLPCNVLPLP